MTITPETARLLLFMLGQGASRIRPGEYTANDTMEMMDRLREVANDAILSEPTAPTDVDGE